MDFLTSATSLKALQQVARDSLGILQVSKICLLDANGVCTTADESVDDDIVVDH